MRRRARTDCFLDVLRPYLVRAFCKKTASFNYNQAAAEVSARCLQKTSSRRLSGGDATSEDVMYKERNALLWLKSRRLHFRRLKPVPMNLRNAPTKLMKDLGYSAGYEKYTTDDLLPKKLKGKKYLKPRD